jgi:hypothetical protein
VALQASFRLKVQAYNSSQGRVHVPPKVKNASKKNEPPLDLTGPWRGLGAETPQQCGPFLGQK